jgi:hypothetical protein
VTVTPDPSTPIAIGQLAKGVTFDVTLDPDDPENKRLIDLLSGSSSVLDISMGLDDEAEKSLEDFRKVVETVRGDAVVRQIEAELTRWYSKAKRDGQPESILDLIIQVSVMVSSYRSTPP